MLYFIAIASVSDPSNLLTPASTNTPLPLRPITAYVKDAQLVGLSRRVGGIEDVPSTGQNSESNDRNLWINKHFIREQHTIITHYLSAGHVISF